LRPGLSKAGQKGENKEAQKELHIEKKWGCIAHLSQPLSTRDSKNNLESVVENEVRGALVAWKLKLSH